MNVLLAMAEDEQFETVLTECFSYIKSRKSSDLNRDPIVTVFSVYWYING